jgi:hypothetical protein
MGGGEVTAVSFVARQTLIVACNRRKTEEATDYTDDTDSTYQWTPS